jgi:hypothetical protein
LKGMAQLYTPQKNCLLNSLLGQNCHHQFEEIRSLDLCFLQTQLPFSLGSGSERMPH